jgi:hypothetical protein
VCCCEWAVILGNSVVSGACRSCLGDLASGLCVVLCEWSGTPGIWNVYGLCELLCE